MMMQLVSSNQVQRAAAVQDAAGASAELQQEIEKLKTEAAQAGGESGNPIGEAADVHEQRRRNHVVSCTGPAPGARVEGQACGAGGCKIQLNCKSASWCERKGSFRRLTSSMDFDDVRSQAKEEASLQVQASAEQLQHEVERLKAEVAEAGCDGAA